MEATEHLDKPVDETPHPLQIDRYCNGEHPFGLSERQHKFVVNLHQTGRKGQSAIDAGYAPGSAKTAASKLMLNRKVLAYLNALRDRAAKDINFTPQLIMEQLWRNHELASGLRPIDVDKSVPIKKDGKTVGYKTIPLQFRIFNPDASNKALELMGRHMAMFLDRKALELPDGLTMRFNFGDGRSVDASLETTKDKPDLIGADVEVILET